MPRKFTNYNLYVNDVPNIGLPNIAVNFSFKLHQLISELYYRCQISNGFEIFELSRLEVCGYREKSGLILAKDIRGAVESARKRLC